MPTTPEQTVVIGYVTLDIEKVETLVYGIHMDMATMIPTTIMTTITATIPIPTTEITTATQTHIATVKHGVLTSHTMLDGCLIVDTSHDATGNASQDTTDQVIVV